MAYNLLRQGGKDAEAQVVDIVKRLIIILAVKTLLMYIKDDVSISIYFMFVLVSYCVLVLLNR